MPAKLITTIFVIASITCVCHCEVTKFERILNGDKARNNQFPFMLALENEETQYCGAVAIGKKWALTAAHCVADEDIDGLYIRSGSLRRNQDGFIHEVKTVIYPGLYNSQLFWNDIALLEIQPPFSKKEHVKYVSLPHQGERVTPDTIAVVAGWGRVNYHTPSSKILRYGKVKVLSNKSCNALPVFEDVYITENMICAAVDGTDSTKGDSGGPLVVQTKNGGKLIGIVSWGDGTGEISNPGIYTQVSSYRRWINKHTKL